jgi:cardiolipin synthase
MQQDIADRATRAPVTLLGDGTSIRGELGHLIDQAQHELAIIMYMFKNDDSGAAILASLVNAARRGVSVRLILDAFGSGTTPGDFFAPLAAAGGMVLWFNTGWHPRYLFRNHQKMVIADGQRVLIGGFNVGDEYFADGVTAGWRELGAVVEGPEVQVLANYFDRLMSALISGKPSLWALRDAAERARVETGSLIWLISGPGIRRGRYGRQLKRDLNGAQRLSLVMAYFVPTATLRRMIGRIARRGSAALVLPKITDVPIVRTASWYTFRRLLRDGCAIYEYQPQPLHAKIIVIDDIVYLGSMNMDIRSLHLNFEIALRVHDPELAEQARQLIAQDIALSRRVTPEDYNVRSGLVQRFIRSLAYSIVNRLDYFVGRRFLD